MSTKFTPGPWPIERTGDGKRIVVGDGLVEGYYEVAEVYSDDCDPEEAKANAHLIAAAPQLYEALAETEALLEGGLSDGRKVNAVRAANRAALSAARSETVR